VAISHEENNQNKNSHDRKVTRQKKRYGEKSNERVANDEGATASEEMGERVAFRGGIVSVGANGSDGGGAKSSVGAAAMERPICRQSSLHGVPP